jgi:dCMP deaminase
MKKEKIAPRKVPSRDEKYMGLAFIYAALSKDPKTQHGAQVVTRDNEPLGSGYNGPPKTMNDDEIDWGRGDGEGNPGKYPYMVHAEPNAIDHSDKHKLKDAVIYVTGKPCKDCMLDIAKSGISEVIYYEDKNLHDANSMCVKEKDVLIAEDIAVKNGVKLRAFSGDLRWLRDRVNFMENLGIFSKT